jgi:tetratricopeptide (TPR) repeat protein
MSKHVTKARVVIGNFEMLKGDSSLKYLEKKFPDLIALTLIGNENVDVIPGNDTINQILKNEHTTGGERFNKSNIANAAFEKKQNQVDNSIEEYCQNCSYHYLITGNFSESYRLFVINVSVKDYVNNLPFEWSSGYVSSKNILDKFKELGDRFDSYFKLRSVKTINRIATICFRGQQDSSFFLERTITDVLSENKEINARMEYLPLSGKIECEDSAGLAATARRLKVDALVFGEYKKTSAEPFVIPAIYVLSMDDSIKLSEAPAAARRSRGHGQEFDAEQMVRVIKDALLTIIDSSGAWNTALLSNLKNLPDSQLLDSCRSFYARYEYNAASFYCNKYLTHDPNSVSAQLLMARIKTKQNFYKEALKYYRMLEKNPADSTKEEIADAYFNIGYFGMAISKYQEIKFRNTNKNFKLGVCFFYLDSARDSKSYLLKSISEDSLHRKAYSYLGQNYYNLSDYDSALYYFLLAERKDTLDETTTSGIVDSYSALGENEIRKKNPSLAVEYFLHALDYPSDPDLIDETLADLIIAGYLPAARNYSEGIIARKILTPAMIYLKQLDLLSGMLSYPSTEFIVSRDSVVIEAVYYLQKLLKSDSTNSETYNFAGSIYNSIDSIHLSEKAFAKSVSLDSMNYVAWQNLAEAQIMRNHFISAQKSINRIYTFSETQNTNNGIIALFLSIVVLKMQGLPIENKVADLDALLQSSPSITNWEFTSFSKWSSKISDNEKRKFIGDLTEKLKALAIVN